MVFTEHLIRSRMQFAASPVLLAGFTTCVVVFPFGHDWRSCLPFYLTVTRCVGFKVERNQLPALDTGPDTLLFKMPLSHPLVVFEELASVELVLALVCEQLDFVGDCSIDHAVNDVDFSLQRAVLPALPVFLSISRVLTRINFI